MTVDVSARESRCEVSFRSSLISGPDIPLLVEEAQPLVILWSRKTEEATSTPARCVSAPNFDPYLGSAFDADWILNGSPIYSGADALSASAYCIRFPSHEFRGRLGIPRGYAQGLHQTLLACG